MAFSKLHNAKGFTLIELVIIIVVLGILAAVAIPKYQDISGEAEKPPEEPRWVRSGPALRSSTPTRLSPLEPPPGRVWPSWKPTVR